MGRLHIKTTFVVVSTNPYAKESNLDPKDLAERWSSSLRVSFTKKERKLAEDYFTAYIARLKAPFQGCSPRDALMVKNILAQKGSVISLMGVLHLKPVGYYLQQACREQLEKQSGSGQAGAGAP